MPQRRLPDQSIARSAEIEADRRQHGRYRMFTGVRPPGTCTWATTSAPCTPGRRQDGHLDPRGPTTGSSPTATAHSSGVLSLVPTLAWAWTRSANVAPTRQLRPQNQLMLPFLSLVTGSSSTAIPTVKVRAGGHRRMRHETAAHLPGPPGHRRPLLPGQPRPSGRISSPPGPGYVSCAQR